MTTAYSPLLGLALPVTGELSGTWGTTVNNYITSYLDAAVAGTQTINGSQTAVTLSTTNGLTLTQAGNVEVTGSAQYAIINCTGNPPSLLTITAPAASKAYLVLNNTSTAQSVKVVGAGPTTGVTVGTGQAALIAWGGSDFALIATTDLSKLSGVLSTAKGGTGLTNFSSANNAIYSTSSLALTAGTLPVAAGGTGQTTYTDGQLLIGNTGSNTLNKATLTAGTNITITNGPGSITIAAAGGGMVYPGAGIPNSTGSAWATSYSTTGGGTAVRLARYPVSEISTSTAASAYTLYVLLTSGIILTLPTSPTVGDWVQVNNSSGATNCVIARNGQNIESLAEDMTVNALDASFTLVYASATRGWVLAL